MEAYAFVFQSLRFVPIHDFIAGVATLVFAFRFDLVERGLSPPLLAVYHFLCLCKRLTKASVAVGALCSVAADVVEAHCNS